MSPTCCTRSLPSRRTAIALLAGAAASSPFEVSAAEPIKLGVALSLTGRFADSARYIQQGYQFWADETNAAGGLDGRPVQLVVYDDESNPDTGRVLAERLINRDGVLLILGPYSSPITDAMATACERAQVPLIGTIASDASIWARRKLTWTFQAFPSSDYDHEAFLAVVNREDKDKRRTAIIFEESPFSVGAKDWAVAKAKELNLSIDAYGYTPGAQDFSSIVERIVASGATSVSMGGYYQPAIALTRQMIDRGYNPSGYHFILAADEVTKDALGANANGIFGRSAWEASNQDAASQGFVRSFMSKNNSLPTYHSAVAYASGQLIASAIKSEGFERQKLRSFFATQSVKTILGDYKLNARGQQEGYRYVLVQWQKGERKLVGSASDTPVIWPKAKWV